MKVDPTVTHYSNRADYLSKKASGLKPAPILNPSKNLDEKKTEISKEAKELNKGPVPKEETPPIDGNEASTPSNGSVDLPNPPLPSKDVLPELVKKVPDLPLESAAKGIEKVEQMIMPKAPTVINKPGIFLISGLNLLEGNGGGLTKMSEYIPDSEHHFWDDEEKIIEEIKKRPAYQPIILVGHGFGGDTAVNIANKLNTMEHGFKTVDLMITMDSIGLNNDLIPPNVKNNINYIGDKDFLINDGPNIALDPNRTDVLNEIRHESHNEIKDSADVQMKIFGHIIDTVGDTRKFNSLVEKATQKYELLKKIPIDGISKI